MTPYDTGLAIGSGIIIFWILFCLVSFAFWLWMFIDCIKKKKTKKLDKIVWIIGFIVFSMITAIVYAIIEKRWKK